LFYKGILRFETHLQDPLGRGLLSVIDLTVPRFTARCRAYVVQDLGMKARATSPRRLVWAAAEVIFGAAIPIATCYHPRHSRSSRRYLTGVTSNAIGTDGARGLLALVSDAWPALRLRSCRLQFACLDIDGVNPAMQCSATPGPSLASGTQANDRFLNCSPQRISHEVGAVGNVDSRMFWRLAASSHVDRVAESSE
jgi:hypothetical protein